MSQCTACIKLMPHFLTHWKVADRYYSEVHLFLQNFLSQGRRNTVCSQKTTWDCTPSRLGAGPSALKPSLWVHRFCCGKNQEPLSPSFILLIIPTEHTQHVKAAPDSIFIYLYSGHSRGWRLKTDDSCSTGRSTWCRGRVGLGRVTLCLSLAILHLSPRWWRAPGSPRTWGGSLCPGTLRRMVTDQQSSCTAKSHRIKD